MLDRDLTTVSYDPSRGQVTRYGVPLHGNVSCNEHNNAFVHDVFRISITHNAATSNL
mgnify:CR=1 FL=1